jgi:hypothetical protein
MSGGAVTATVGSTLGTAIVALAVILGRTRERVVRLEEWVRLKDRDKDPPSV